MKPKGYRLHGSVGAAALVLSACTVLAPERLPPGSPISQARGAFGGPTGEHPLPEGGTRLEFARGSLGRETHMLDFDAAGRLVHVEEVLDPAHFATIAPGMTPADVGMRLGRPAGTYFIGWQKRSVWYYRYAAERCVLFEVSFNGAGRVLETGPGVDPVCNAPRH